MEDASGAEAYMNGAVSAAVEAAAAAEQVAPQALAELQAAVASVAEMHALAAQPLPVVVGAFADAMAVDPSQAGTPMDSGLGGGGGSGRARASSGSFKNRLAGSLYCQVDGCGAPLEGLKEYHQRYKVCEEHLKTPYIIRDGQQVRFCQQCGRFQPLSDFDDNKRSCRVRLQRHNARRRKRSRDGGAAGSAADFSDYGMASAQAAAEMAKLAQYAAQPAAVPAKELQAMQEALHFASTTLAHSGQVPPKAPEGEGGEGEDGEAEGGGVGMGPNSMPFVPTPDVMMLLLKGYAAMFHYILDAATIRPLAPPSELPGDQGAGALALGGGMDAAQMQQLMQAQGLLGGQLPVLGGEGQQAEEEGGEEGEEEEGAAQGQEGEDEGMEEVQAEGGGGGGAGAAAAAGAAQHAEEQAALQAAAAAHGLTAEQVAAALIQPMPTDAAHAAATEGAMAAAAALAADGGVQLAAPLEFSEQAQQAQQAAEGAAPGSQ